jgi:hypothetical protein
MTHRSKNRSSHRRHGDATEGSKLEIFGDGSVEINSHENSGS